ncbi:MAG: amino acid adenylation domain-containing protein [Bacteroidales bacterium]|nr:amino acid adenylation domain-containing protein [Bacteroidales bacterium]
MEFKSLVEVLIARSSSISGVTFIENSSNEEKLSYTELYNNSLKVLCNLQQKGLVVGDEVVIHFDNNKSFIVVFWACILGGFIPVPLTVPRNQEQALKTINVWKFLRTPCLATFEQNVDRLINIHGQAEFIDSIRDKIFFEKDLFDGNELGNIFYPKEDDLAYIQFSSGSTGTPKGVKLTHKNLITNTLSIIKGIKPSAEGEVYLSWMPLTHDMGLIGLHITPLVANWEHFIMPTDLFIRRPSLWLHKVDEHRITYTASPNFGYRYLLNRLDFDSAENLNLSSLRLITNGAEPISYDLCIEFAEKLARYGLRKNVIFPVYGLAEASVGVSFSEPEDEIQKITINRNFLNAGDQIQVVNSGEDGITFVNVGKPIEKCYVKIIQSHKDVEENIIGSICIKGDNVTSGYYNNEKATNEILEKDGWVNTGDLGFINNGSLFITGRAKDIIFINGQNYYPHDLERCAEELDGIELGKIATAGYFNDKLQKEEVLAFVLHKGKLEDFIPIAINLKKHIIQRFGFEVDRIIQVREIPKTTSGKIQRYKLKENYLLGLYSEICDKIDKLILERNQSEYQSPRNEIEELLVEIWQEVFGIERIGVNDDFFILGGNSILAIRLVSIVNIKLTSQISVGDIFKHSTISRLSVVLQRSIGGFKYKDYLITDGLADAMRAFELTNVQQAYLFGRLGTFEMGNVSTHIYSELLFSHFDGGKFEAALNRLIRRHGALRTVFREDSQAVLQDVPSYRVVSHGPIDQAGLEAIRDRLSHKVYEVGRWPLFDYEVSELGGRSILHMSFDVLIMDGTSMGILLHELGLLYNAEDMERVSLPALRISFRDYVLKYAEVRSGRLYAEAAQYWIDKLGSYSFEAHLPMRVSPGAVAQPKFVRLTRTIPQAKWRAVEDKAKLHNVSHTTVVLYAYGQVLSKWSGRSKLCINLTLFNRLPLHEQVSDILGDFTVLELFSFRRAERESILSSIREIHDGLWRDIEHNLFDGVDFQRLIRKELGISPNHSLSPVVLTSMLGDKNFDISLGGYLGAGYSISQTPQVYLDNKAYQTKEGFIAEWDYVEQLFARGTIEQMHGDYCGIIEYLAEADWETALPEIALSEWERAVIDGANNYSQPEASSTLAEICLPGSGEGSGRVAVIDAQGSYTYQQIGEYSYRVAGYLQDHGLSKANRLVGILSEKGYQQVVSALGIMRSGGAYLPLHVDWPRGRVDEVLEEGLVATVLVSRSEYDGSVKGSELEPKYEWLVIESMVSYQPGVAPDQLATPRMDDTAYVIFTSGSTGRPKGVAISHRGAVNTIVAVNDRFRVDKGDKVLALSELSFDLSVYDIFGMLAAGGTIVFPDQERVKEPHHWYGLIREHGITVWDTVPQLMQLLVDYANDTGQALGTLRVVLMSGDWIPVKLPGQIKALNPSATVMSLGGATEGSIWSVWYEVGAVDPSWSSIPYGHAMPNQKMYVLNEFKEHCPVGVTGDIYIGGQGVAVGYWNDEAKTRASFTQHERLGRLYRTGDSGRWSGSGYMEFEGRKDSQVKLNGYRVELDEISSKLTKVGGVDKALVTVQDNQLVAYLVLGRQAGGRAQGIAMLDGAERERFGLEQKGAINQQLRHYLPQYMLPSCYITLDELPLTANGKVDLKKLPKAEIVQEEYVAPSTELEEEIAGIWQEVLGADRVSVTDDFFRIGGNSMLAIRLVSMVNIKLGAQISVGDIFKHSTISRLSVVLQRSIGGFKYKDYLITDGLADAMRAFELTNVQQAYLFGRLGTFEMGNVSTHIYSELLFSHFDGGKFEAALNRLIRRHGALRTVFREDSQAVLQDVPSYRVVSHGPIDQAGLEAIRDRLSHKVYEVGRWPLFDYEVSELGGRSILHMSFDVLIMDGTSMGILLHELGLLYNAEDMERVSLPALRISFRDYVLKYAEVRSGRLYAEAAQYWIDKLGSYSFEAHLPMRVSPGAVAQPKFVRLTRTIPQAKWRAVEDKAKLHNVSHTTVVLYAYGQVLSKWSGRSKLCINLTLFNRLPLHEQVSDILGDFTVLELFSFRRAERESILSSIREIHDGLWRDIEHNLFDGVDFQRLIRKELGISPNHSLSPVVLTSMLGDKNFDISLGGYLGAGYSISQTPQVYLDNKAYQTKEGFIAEWDYVEQLFARGTIEQMHGDYCGIIEYLAEADWETALPEIALSEWERAVIDGANNYSQPEASSTLAEICLPGSGEGSGRVAVIDAQGSYTYQQIGEYSYRVAGYLQDHGLSKANRLVGILSEKGYQQVVSALGIMRSGGAYLPLHVDWPRGRVDEVLEEGLVATVLVSRSEYDGSVKGSELEPKYEWLVIESMVSYQPGVAPDQLATPRMDDTAYVIFTSGSTGRPKGVAISHRGAVNTIVAVNDRFRVDKGDKVLALSELSFDLSVYDIFGMLAAGGTIVFPDQERVKEPHHWYGLIREHGITVWDTVPQLMQLLVDYANDTGQALGTLRVVLMSGDWIPVKLPGQIKALNPSATVMSLGGATEGSIWSVWYEVGAVDPSWSSIPYGHAMPNQKMYVLNEFKEHCPVGVTGDIYIGGQGVAVGYWNDEAKTRASFTQHERLGRLYRTGDSGRWSGSGYMEFEGRKDSQVKLNGYRVELDEISSKLTKVGGVDKALVTVQDNQLVAYLVLGRQAGGRAQGIAMLDGAERERFGLEQKGAINQQLRHYLPQYMLPSCYITLDELPLTANGKVDLKKLPKAEIVQEEYVAPSTELEEEIAGIWQEVLGADRVSVTDDFFRIGGNSMLAIRVNHKINEVLKTDYSLKQFYRYSSIDSFVKNILSGNCISEQQYVNLKEEAILPEDIQINTPFQPTNKPPKNIFLTGSTGFVGRFLLHELLCSTDATIFCLVRGKDNKEAHDRLIGTLKESNLFKPTFFTRIVPVIGDICKPSLGISKYEYLKLCSEIDVVFHNATMMNHQADYYNLKQSNVLGTIELLRFAMREKIKPIHYTSTLAVFSPISGSGSPNNEYSTIDNEKHLISDGYASSKWVAEKIIHLAKERGFPINTNRLGLVTGDIMEGRSDEKQWFYMLLQSCVQLNKSFFGLPKSRFGITPVDFTVKAIVSLALNDKYLNGIYHICNPEEIMIEKLLQLYSGDDIKQVSIKEWMYAANKHLNSGEELALKDLIFEWLKIDDVKILEETIGVAASMNSYDSSATINSLAKEGVCFPEINAELINKYFHFVRTKMNVGSKKKNVYQES